MGESKDRVYIEGSDTLGEYLKGKHTTNQKTNKGNERRSKIGRRKQHGPRQDAYKNLKGKSIVFRIAERTRI